MALGFLSSIRAAKNEGATSNELSFKTRNGSELTSSGLVKLRYESELSDFAANIDANEFSLAESQLDKLSTDTAGEVIRRYSDAIGSLSDIFLQDGKLDKLCDKTLHF